MDGPVVTHSQLKAMLSRKDIRLIDVRTPREFQAGRIPQAVNVPLDVLEESLRLSPHDFEKQFGAKAPEKDDANVVFQCRSGCRSATALGIARNLGFHRARHYGGGYLEWEEKELKTEL